MAFLTASKKKEQRAAASAPFGDGFDRQLVGRRQMRI
jgi:hypothetical protein